MLVSYVPAPVPVNQKSRTIGSVSRQINNTGVYTPFGSVRLSAGTHHVELRYTLGLGPDGTALAVRRPLPPWAARRAQTPRRYFSGVTQSVNDSSP